MSKTMTGTPRSKWIKFRVRPDEQVRIQLNAMREHAPVSEYLRELGKQGGPVARPASEDAAA